MVLFCSSSFHHLYFFSFFCVTFSPQREREKEEERKSYFSSSCHLARLRVSFVHLSLFPSPFHSTLFVFPLFLFRQNFLHSSLLLIQLSRGSKFLTCEKRTKKNCMKHISCWCPNVQHLSESALKNLNKKKFYLTLLSLVHLPWLSKMRKYSKSLKARAEKRKYEEYVRNPFFAAVVVFFSSK